MGVLFGQNKTDLGSFFFSIEANLRLSSISIWRFSGVKPTQDCGERNSSSSNRDLTWQKRNFKDQNEISRPLISIHSSFFDFVSFSLTSNVFGIGYLWDTLHLLEFCPRGIVRHVY
jgi:hypothetical protein